MEDYTERISIKAWAEDDRPREKLMHKGTVSLSDAELVAILIGSGNADESAVELSKRILASVNNNLHDLAKLGVRDLMKFKGIGEAKAISIVAALELGRRRKDDTKPDKPKITSSNDAFEVMAPLLSDLPHEEFWVLLLNRANKVLHKALISRGGITGTVADTRIIYKLAIDYLACSIILCHNHPSGNLTPSSQDFTLTRNLVAAGKTMDIPVLDHLIISDEGYYSFADEGTLG